MYPYVTVCTKPGHITLVSSIYKGYEEIGTYNIRVVYYDRVWGEK